MWYTRSFVCLRQLQRLIKKSILKNIFKLSPAALLTNTKHISTIIIIIVIIIAAIISHHKHSIIFYGCKVKKKLWARLGRSNAQQYIICCSLITWRCCCVSERTLLPHAARPTIEGMWTSSLIAISIIYHTFISWQFQTVAVQWHFVIRYNLF